MQVMGYGYTQDLFSAKAKFLLSWSVVYMQVFMFCEIKHVDSSIRQKFHSIRGLDIFKTWNNSRIQTTRE